MSENTDKHKLYHVLVLDRSGSMGGVVADTIGGFNQNLSGMREDQRDEIEQRVCLVTFANDVEMPVWCKPLDEVSDLGRST